MSIFECLWVFTGVHGSICVFGFLGIYGYLYYYIYRCHGCLWGFMDFWVSMSTYGWHKSLWVLYVNIKNIAFFLI